jgi:ribose transport system substrate-binding protein
MHVSIKALCAVGLVSILSITSTAVSAKQITLAYVADSLQFPYDVAVGKGFQEVCQELGCKALVLDGRESTERQGNTIDDLVAQQVSGIAVIPTDAIVSQTWVDRLSEENIPVVAVGAQVGDAKKFTDKHVYPNLTALVTGDEDVMNQNAGQLAAKLLPKGRTAKIAIIEGMPGFSVVAQRTEGFKAGLDKAGVKYQIVASQPTNWTAEKGEAVCQNILTAHPDLDLFYSHSDDMVPGCIRAIHSSGSKAKLVATSGGSRLGDEAIKTGELDGSVCQRPEQLGRLAAKALYDAVTGKNTTKAQFITVDTPAITKANLSVCPAW